MKEYSRKLLDKALDAIEAAEMLVNTMPTMGNLFSIKTPKSCCFGVFDKKHNLSN
jgi:hypothetical protein